MADADIAITRFSYADAASHEPRLKAAVREPARYAIRLADKADSHYAEPTGEYDISRHEIIE